MPDRSDDHKAQPPINRPEYGYFHRNEWAILGTPNANIRQLAGAIVDRLSEICKVAYVDSDQRGGESQDVLQHGASLVYTKRVSYHQFSLKAQLDTYLYRRYFNDQDAVIVNGNYFPAKRQIVVVDPQKEESLRGKLDQLTDVRLLLLAEGVNAPFPWLKEALKDFQNIPQMKLADDAGIPLFIEKELGTLGAPLFGLVLAGGKSERMGEDKGLINYHGLPQRQHARQLLQHYCKEVFISCRADQMEGVTAPLPDTFTELGPLGGLLSAFRTQPDAAWLVLPCDLPLLGDASLSQLVGFRNASRAATAFYTPDSKLPEPLVSIWEPRAYPLLLQFLAYGQTSLRRALIHAETELIEAEHPQALRPANTPEEVAEIKEILKAAKK